MKYIWPSLLGLMAIPATLSAQPLQGLYGFTLQESGSRPYGGLALAGKTLYGTASYGTSGNSGSVFKINTDGTGFAVLKGFTNGADGGGPKSRLVLSGTTLYGTTGNGYGALFRLSTNGADFAVLKRFSQADGVYPSSDLLLNKRHTLRRTSPAGPLSVRNHL